MEPKTANTQLHKSKKKKKKASKVDATIEMLKEHPYKNAPTLGYYPSGFDPLNRTGNPESNAVKLYRNTKKQKRVEVVIKANKVEVDFVGTNYSGEAAVGKMNSFAIGVLDKSTQLLKICPINANKVFRLQPLARASQISDKEPETPAKTASAEDKRDQQALLFNLYGTKTAITQTKKVMELRQQAEDGSQPEVSQAIENTPVDKEAVVGSNTDISRDIPPHDLSATTPEKAYLLDKIISKGDWFYLKDILELLQSGKEINSDVYPSFVCNRYYKVELLKDKAGKERLAGIMSYISHLINFKNQHSLDGRSPSNSSKNQKFIPTLLLLKFKRMFLNEEKNRLADDKIGSLISYVLVLTLFIDEFQTDFTDIAKDLKMSAFSLRSYFENLGCQFRRRAYVAHLLIPLKFPVVVGKKRRRG